jgi:hypothetical protein
MHTSQEASRHGSLLSHSLRTSARTQENWAPVSTSAGKYPEFNRRFTHNNGWGEEPTTLRIVLTICTRGVNPPSAAPFPEAFGSRRQSRFRWPARPQFQHFTPAKDLGELPFGGGNPLSPELLGVRLAYLPLHTETRSSISPITSSNSARERGRPNSAV